jgi:hypothetical protein
VSQTKIQKKQIYIGTRKVSSQNFSKIIALPKIALTNCGNPSHFEIYLVEEGETEFIMLTPTHSNKRDDT